MALEFENYHSHTCMSNALALADSVVTYQEYAEEYKRRGMHCLFSTEHANRGNVFECQRITEGMTASGYDMRTIVSAECYFVPDRKEKDNTNAHLILVARDMDGYRQLNKILSESYQSGFYYRNRIDFDLLSQLDTRKFICTTACVAGPVLKFGDKSERIINQLHEIFGENFFLEIQPHPADAQANLHREVLRLYRKYGYPLIYATDSHYIRREDKVLRDELLKSSHIVYEDESSFELYLPTADEGYRILTEQGIFSDSQIREAFERTLMFREFEGFHYSKEKKIPNAYPNLSQQERNNLYRRLVYNAYDRMYGDTPFEQQLTELDDMERNEIAPVVDTGTADYFLILKRIMDRGAELGGHLTYTGRGSAVSFVSNHLLGLTSINRQRCAVKMYPERFISRDRMASGSMPDYDANIANLEAYERAGKEILGEYGCLPMVAYGCVRKLAAFKMLARARDIPFETANIVSQQIGKYETAMKHASEDERDEIQLSDYVSPEYLPLIEDSKKYEGIITTLTPQLWGCAMATLRETR